MGQQRQTCLSLGFHMNPQRPLKVPCGRARGQWRRRAGMGAEVLGPAAQGRSQFPTVIKAAVGSRL